MSTGQEIILYCTGYSPNASIRLENFLFDWEACKAYRDMSRLAVYNWINEIVPCSFGSFQKKLNEIKIHIKCLLKVYARSLKVYMYYSISEAVPMFIFI